MSKSYQLISRKKIIHTDLKPENILLSRPTDKILEVIEKYEPEDKLPLIKRKNLENLTKQQKKRLKKRLEEKEKEEKEKLEQIQLNNTEINEVTEKEDSDEKEEEKMMQEFKEKQKKILENFRKFQGSFVKIADFGNGCWVDKQFSEEIQTRQYRSPEVILGQKYNTSADIWSLGCLIFELATGDYLFDPKFEGDIPRDEDHLALMIETLGKLPQEIFKGKNFNKYFNIKNELKHVQKLNFWSLKSILIEKYKFQPKEAEDLSNFLSLFLEYIPSKRSKAKDLLKHPWLTYQEFSTQELESMVKEEVEEKEEIDENKEKDKNINKEENKKEIIEETLDDIYYKLKYFENELKTIDTSKIKRKNEVLKGISELEAELEHFKNKINHN